MKKQNKNKHDFPPTKIEEEQIAAFCVHLLWQKIEEKMVWFSVLNTELEVNSLIQNSREDRSAFDVVSPAEETLIE